MEPIVLFAAAVVLYCGWLTLKDDLQEFRRSSVARRLRRFAKLRPQLRKISSSGVYRAGGAAAHWPAPAKGSA